MTPTSEHVASFRAQSFLYLPGLFRDNVDQVSAWVDAVASWKPGQNGSLHFYERDHPERLSRIENFVPFHEGLSGILNGPALLGLLQELTGESYYLYKDRINYKPPGGGAHSAHQDGVAYEAGLEASAFEQGTPPYLSVYISVDATTPENGCFEVVQGWGWDRLEILPMERPLAEDPRFSKIAATVENALPWVPLETRPGDAIIFTERLPHRSGRNRSATGRRILYGVYNPASEGDKRTAYFEQKRRSPDDPRYMVGNPHAPTAR